MMASRHAGSPLSSSGLALVRGAAVTIGVALGLALGAMAAIAIRMARRVVTPAGRVPDTTIVSVDTSAQTITLSRTDDTVLPGQYGLFTTGTESYVKLGSVLSENDHGVTRKLLTQIGPDSALSAAAAFSGWYFDHPDQLHLPYTAELIGSAVGPCPAWLFPAADPTDTWVIQVHGRGTTRAECLRAVPVFHAAGITSLVVSYRNDGDAPRSRSGTYALGATEWRDIDVAIGFARRRGARRIVLMGWSMGGAIVLQAALHSAHRDLIAGVILDSPVVDWRIVLHYQAGLIGLPSPLARLAVGMLAGSWTAPIAGSPAPIPFDRLDVVTRADELRCPVLILHSDDDGFVPSDASHQLQAARPDLVDLEVFRVARHTKLWNYDGQRWRAAITRWLARRDLTAAPSEASDAV